MSASVTALPREDWELVFHPDVERGIRQAARKIVGWSEGQVEQEDAEQEARIVVAVQAEGYRKALELGAGVVNHKLFQDLVDVYRTRRAEWQRTVSLDAMRESGYEPEGEE